MVGLAISIQRRCNMNNSSLMRYVSGSIKQSLFNNAEPNATLLDELEHDNARLRHDLDTSKRELELHHTRWHALLADVEAALHHRTNKGGQQCGVPTYAMAPVSMLKSLQRECTEALSQDTTTFCIGYAKETAEKQAKEDMKDAK